MPTRPVAKQLSELGDLLARHRPRGLYDEKCEELADYFLEKTEHLFTQHHTHHLALAIQKAVDEYITQANDNYEPPDPPGFKDGFCDNH